MITTLITRMAQKHDLEANWLKDAEFVPMQGELIVYDIEVDSDGNTLELPEGRIEPYLYERLKIGDGITAVCDLPFMDEILNIASANVFHQGTSLASLVESYLLNINYDSLAFDTSEIVFNTSTSSVLGQAILGQMILA